MAHGEIRGCNEIQGKTFAKHSIFGVFKDGYTRKELFPLILKQVRPTYQTNGVGPTQTDRTRLTHMPRIKETREREGPTVQDRRTNRLAKNQKWNHLSLMRVWAKEEDDHKNGSKLKSFPPWYSNEDPPG